ncbi:hypothetical protein D3C75_850000 [compost metagenome]
MAVRLSGAGYRLGQRAGLPGQHPDQLPGDLRHCDELLLHPPAGRSDLRHGRDADQAAPDCQRGGSVQGDLRQLQRRRFLWHEVQGDCHPGPGRFRCLGRQGETVSQDAEHHG